MSSDSQDLCLYTAHSPNGYKISITLEELGLPYQVVLVDMGKLAQKSPEFPAINPNGRIPALTDSSFGGISLFESGSIMQYLVDRYDPENKLSYARGTKEYYQTNNWLFFQNAGIGPMQGQLNHFVHFSLASEPIPYAIDRYRNECRRLYRTVNDLLQSSGSDFLVGEKMTIADIALWSWVDHAAYSTVDLSEFPILTSWHKRIAARPGVQRGRKVPRGPDIHDAMKDEKTFEEFIKGGKAWVAKGAAEDAK